MNHQWDGEAVKQLRNRMGLTQEDFAHELGVTVSTINRWEKGKAKPTKLASTALDQLQKALGQ